MKRRQLGHTQIEVAPLAFGGNVFGWTVNEATSFALLDRFVDAGCNLIDTADVYSRWVPGHAGGESETVIGKWLKHSGKRDRVILATKVGMEMGPGKKGLSKNYIFRAVEDSLRRLQTDYIDLYQSHIDDPDTSLEETLETFGELVKQGKVRAIGASNYQADRLQQAARISRQHGYPHYECLQPEYNLYQRAGYECTMEPICAAHGIGVITYFSLASGFLTGKYRNKQDMAKSARGSSMDKYMTARGFRILDELENTAKQYNATPARVALAWLMARPSVTAPIASATSIAQLDELIAATELTLDQAAIERLNAASE